MTGRQRCGEARRPPPTCGPCGALQPNRRIATPHAHGIEAGRTSRRVRDGAFPRFVRSFRAKAVMPRKGAVLRESESPLHAATRVDTRRPQAGAAPRRALAIKEPSQRGAAWRRYRRKKDRLPGRGGSWRTAMSGRARPDRGAGAGAAARRPHDIYNRAGRSCRETDRPSLGRIAVTTA